jgi:putative ABC transport system ATP-binding protein
VMVTHDPIAAGHADGALFLADGRVVDAISRPTAARVLDRIKALGSSGGGAAAELRDPSSAERG